MAVVTRDELEASLASLRAEVLATGDGKAGILGPGSTAWRLGGDLAVFLGGGRAALLQLAHPMVAHAVDHHSRTRADVAGRFQRTFRHVFAMLFGELDDALTAARRVHAIHTRIHGTFPAAVGRWPAGSAYAANDADALRWVHATLVDTVLVVRELLGPRLDDGARDGYVRDLNRFGALFAIPRALLPTSHAAHAAYMRAMLDDAATPLAVAPCAREMAAFLLGRGDGAAQHRLGAAVEQLTSALLPPRWARDLGLAPTRGGQLAVRAAIAALRPLYRALPRAAVALPAHTAARRRLAGAPPSRRAAWLDERLAALARAATR